MTLDRPSKPGHEVKVTVSQAARQVDRDLAASLGQMHQAPHANSECNGSVVPLAVETAVWIVMAAMVWVAVALSL